MSEPQQHDYAFGDFWIDTAARQLLRHDDTPVALTPRVFDTLLLLVENAGKIVSKDALLAAIWPNRVVEENNLTQNISTLRRVLGAGARDHRYILTEPGRGYRFVEAVHRDTPSGATNSGSTAEALDPTPTLRARAVEVSPTAAVPAALNARSLRRPALIAAGLIALASVSIIGWLWPTQAIAPVSTPVLAVLPFKPLLPDAHNEVLQLGMADTLITKLSTNRHIVVRSLDAVRRVAHAQNDPIAAGSALNASFVLEGYMQRQGDRVRVNTRLLAVPDGAALWTGTFDANFSDVFALQDAIAEKVAAALSLKLDRDERRRMTKNYTANTAAYQLYLAGRVHLQNATPRELVASIDSFRRALKIDPDYALAYVGLAEGYRRQVIISDADPQIVLPLAKAAALHALSLDDTLAEAWVPIGFVHFWYDWDWAAAEAAFRRGIELQPNFADLHFGYAALLSNLGRQDEALRESQRARELDPLSPLYVALEASFVAYAGHVDEARQQIDGVLRAHPDFWIAHLARGWIDANDGDYADAVNDFGAASKSSGGSQQATAMLGFALARGGRTMEARRLLDSLLTRARVEYVPATSIATIYCGLGDSEQALTWLERGYAARDVRMTFIKVDRRWDTLRRNPRFIAIAQKMRLP